MNFVRCGEQAVIREVCITCKVGRSVGKSISFLDYSSGDGALQPISIKLSFSTYYPLETEWQSTTISYFENE